MPRASAVVTAAELSVLNFLWENGPSVVRVISSTLYQENTPAYHATVNSLLDQLEKKGYVTRDRSGYAHQFEAAVKRDELIGTELQQIADSHFGGALAPRAQDQPQSLVRSDTRVHSTNRGASQTLIHLVGRLDRRL